MHEIALDLRQTVVRAADLLLRLSESRVAHRPAPGVWSPKEILGHLIDSASNNHQRFVRAQFQDDLVFPGYAQDAWVEAQHYQNASWQLLVMLWCDYNLHLAHVIDALPEALCTREHHRHNLHEIAWKTIPEDEPATLEYFVRDYVAHLKHHLKQLLRRFQDATV